MRVSWDDAKDLENRRKHGISFEEAKELFTSGVDYLEIFDKAHSDLEDRFFAIGPISRASSSSGLSGMKRPFASSTPVGLPAESRISMTPTGVKLHD